MLQEQDLRKTIAEKITHYRRHAGLTQSQLAEKLNYSDKSVSKWERGEGLPDVIVLCRMAELFGVTLDDLTAMEKPAVIPLNIKKSRRRIITALAVLLAWLAASAAFFTLKMLDVFIDWSFFDKSWLMFIYAIPVSFIVLTVFSCMWYRTPFRIFSVSGIIWSLFLSIRLSVSVEALNYLLIVCIILQVMTVLWFFLRAKGKHVK